MEEIAVDHTHAFSRKTVWLHWLVAVVMLPMLAIGIYMSLAEAYGLYDIHKSIGLLALPLLAARAAWRLRQGWPRPLGRYRASERWLAKAIHWCLLLGTLALPLSGMLYSAASGHGFGIFGVTLVPANQDPSDPDEVIPYSQLLSVLGETAHEWVGYGLVVILLLHVAGALKHHLVDRDGTLRRMLGRHV